MVGAMKFWRWQTRDHISGEGAMRRVGPSLPWERMPDSDFYLENGSGSDRDWLLGSGSKWIARAVALALQRRGNVECDDAYMTYIPGFSLRATCAEANCWWFG